MRQKPISARINTDVLEYIRGCHQPLNSLINLLLEQWMKKRQNKELHLFQEETGTDELSILAKRHTERSSQCCKNCIYYNQTNECKKRIRQTWGFNFCCIYWEHKKKERS